MNEQIDQFGIPELNEDVQSSNYRTRVKVEYELKTARTPVTLKWDLSIDEKSDGLRGMSISFPEQILSFEIEVEDEEGDEKHEVVTFKLQDPKIEIETKDKLGALIPDRVEIYKGKAIVYF